MIYLVSTQLRLFEDEEFVQLSPEKAVQMIQSFDVIQFDTETRGVDARISPILCAQFGNDTQDARIVVDTSEVDIRMFKQALETKLVILQNGYFDLQFLYQQGIICMNIYDTMIVEQLLYLGYPPVHKGGPGMSLAAIAARRLGVYISKDIRGQINWRGLDTQVIRYAATDVVYLEKIMHSQIADCKNKQCLNAAYIECMFVPVLAYGSWCGIKLDEKAWRNKMESDENKLNKAISDLNEFVLKQNNPEFIMVDTQGDLFSGFDLSPKVNFQWGRPGIKAKKEPIKAFIKSLGFDLTTVDKKTKQIKESVDLKALKKQKGVNDEFLKTYIEYSEALKVVTTYGITYINAINPLTGRIHTQFNQLAADTGRVACSGTDENDDESEDNVRINPDLAKLKGFPLSTKDVTKKCGYPNIQTLPADETTRTCFIAEDNNLFCSCDWSAIESRLGADIYEEKAMIEEFLHGSGDMHSLVAKMVFPELKDIPVKDIKKLYPKLRSAAKPIEFSQQFGGSAEAIRNSMGCSLEEAQKFADAYNNGFKGISKFKAVGSRFVRQNGYILLNPITGHKTYWWDHDKWVERQKSFTQEFWEDYRKNHKGTKDEVARTVSMHFKAASKWDRKALNSVTQGTGAICLKVAARKFFEWIVDNGYFDTVKIVDFVHDELCIEYPESLEHTLKVSNILERIMKDTAAIYCKSLPIPAEAAVGKHWIH